MADPRGAGAPGASAAKPGGAGWPGGTHPGAAADRAIDGAASAAHGLVDMARRAVHAAEAEAAAVKAAAGARARQAEEAVHEAAAGAAHRAAAAADAVRAEVAAAGAGAKAKVEQAGKAAQAVATAAAHRAAEAAHAVRARAAAEVKHAAAAVHGAGDSAGHAVRDGAKVAGAAVHEAAAGVQDAVRHPGAAADRMIDGAAGAAHRGVHAAERVADGVGHAAQMAGRIVREDAGLAAQAARAGAARAGGQAVQVGRAAVADVQGGVRQAGQAGAAVAHGAGALWRQATGAGAAVLGFGHHLADQAAGAAHGVVQGVSHVAQAAKDEVAHDIHAGLQHAGKDLVDAGHAVQGLDSPGSGGIGTLMQRGMRRLGEERDAAVRAGLGSAAHVGAAAAHEVARGAHAGTAAIASDAALAGRGLAAGAAVAGQDLRAVGGALGAAGRMAGADIVHGARQLGAAKAAVEGDEAALAKAAGHGVKHVAGQLARTPLGQAALDTRVGRVVEDAATIAFGDRRDAQALIGKRVIPRDLDQQAAALPAGGSITLGGEYGAKADFDVEGIMLGGGGKTSNTVKLSRSKSGEGFDVAIEKTVNAVGTAAAEVPGVAKLGGEAGVGTSDRTTMHYRTAAEASHAAQQAELGMAANELRVGAGMARSSIGDPRALTRNFLNQAPGAGQGPSASLFNPLGMLMGRAADHFADNVAPDARELADMRGHVTGQRNSVFVNTAVTADAKLDLPAFMPKGVGLAVRGSAKNKVALYRDIQLGADGKPSTMAMGVTQTTALEDRGALTAKQTWGSGAKTAAALAGDARKAEAAALAAGKAYAPKVPKLNALGTTGAELTAGLYETNIIGSLTTSAEAAYKVSDAETKAALRGGGPAPHANLGKPDALRVNAELLANLPVPLSFAGMGQTTEVRLAGQAELSKPGQTAQAAMDDVRHGRLRDAGAAVGRNARLTGTLSLSALQGPASTAFAVKAAVPGAGVEASVGMIDQTRRPVWTGTLDSKPQPKAKPGAGRATPEQRKWIRDHFGVDMEELPSAPTH